MTSLNKKVVRKSEVSLVRDGGKLKALIVTVYPSGVLGLRPEKTRREEIISFESCYSVAVKQRVAKDAAEKRKAKSAKKGK